MGLYLTLYPLRPGALGGHNPIVAFDRLRIEQDHTIHCQLRDLTDDGYIKSVIPVQEIPPGLEILVCGENTEDAVTCNDSWGNRLTYTWAKDLRLLKMSENSFPYNIAIKAFIDALPDNVPVVLFWR